MFEPMAAIYIVQRADLHNVDSIKEAVEKYCKEIIQNEQAIIFVPKNGFIATLGLFFTRKAISYQLEFTKGGHS